jgi:hypothetical protein
MMTDRRRHTITADTPGPPNRRVVVEAVYASGAYDLRTVEGCGCFTEDVVWRLHQTDPAWVHLKKVGGQTAWHGHAVDAILHAPTGYAVDVIASSASRVAAPHWHVDRLIDGGPRYKDRSDLALVPLTGCAGTWTQPLPEPSTPPVPTEPQSPTAAPSDELLALHRRLDAYEEVLLAQGDEIMRLAERLQAMADRLGRAHGVQTGRVWGHVHPVALSFEEE